MSFTLRQLQEKCREQKQPLFIVFVDQTKAFDFVSRKGLFHLLKKVGCPQKLLKVVMSFHEDMKGSVLFDGSSSAVFPIKSGVKQGCGLAPTLFGIFFSLLLSARDALRRRRCPGLPHTKRTARTRKLPGSCMQRIRLGHQPEENKCDGSGRQ